MSWNALVIGDGLVIDQRAVRKVGYGDYHASGALAIRSAGHIVGRGGGIEFRDGLHGDRRLGQQGEQFWKLGLHLRDVVSEVVKNLFGRGRNVLRVGFEGSPERSEVSE